MNVCEYEEERMTWGMRETWGEREREREKKKKSSEGHGKKKRNVKMHMKLLVGRRERINM